MRIGVIGCGVAGMASAMYLARDGHDVTIFDRFAEPRALGAGLLLQPSGQAVLRDLGLLDAVAVEAARIDHLDSRNRSGRRVLDLPYSLAPHGPGLGVHRSRLFAAMWKGLRTLPIETCFGSAVSGLDDNGRALLLEDGRRYGFELIVVAAGVHSPLRRHFAIARDHTYPWGCLWTTLRLPAGQALPVLQQRVDGARIMIGLLPVGLGEAALFWSLRNDRVEEWRSEPLAIWKRRIAEIWPEIEPALETLTGHDQVAHATYRDVALRNPVLGKRGRHWRPGACDQPTARPGRQSCFAGCGILGGLPARGPAWRCLAYLFRAARVAAFLLSLGQPSADAVFPG